MGLKYLPSEGAAAAVAEGIISSSKIGTAKTEVAFCLLFSEPQLEEVDDPSVEIALCI